VSVFYDYIFDSFHTSPENCPLNNEKLKEITKVTGEIRRLREKAWAQKNWGMDCYP
jgi:hypothetical protein